MRYVVITVLSIISALALSLSVSISIAKHRGQEIKTLEARVNNLESQAETINKIMAEYGQRKETINETISEFKEKADGFTDWLHEPVPFGLSELWAETARKTNCACGFNDTL